MPSKDQRRLQKKKERDRRVHHEKLAWAERKTYLESFPTFEFAHTEAAPENFVKVVKVACRQINFKDEKTFTLLERRLYEMGRRHGPEVMTEMWKVAGSESQAMVSFACKVGHVLFNLIGEEELLKWIPFTDVLVLPTGRHILIDFRSLAVAKGPGGTIYYSKKKPIIELDGKSYIVGWSVHAIQQTCSRLKPRWFTYAGLGDVFSFFNDCMYFEPCRMSSGELGFTFYDACVRGFWSEWYVPEVLGVEMTEDDVDKFYYRVGYCPVVLEGSYAKAKTMLFPGYRGTPEYEKILREALNPVNRRDLIEKSKHLTTDTIQKSGDFSLVKWFHEHGIPQVVRSDKKFYADYEGPT